jgi:hypothetical protein
MRRRYREVRGGKGRYREVRGDKSLEIFLEVPPLKGGFRGVSFIQKLAP